MTRARRRVLWFAAFVLTAYPAHAQNEFVGDLILEPAGCEARGKCTVRTDFSYVDPTGIGWTAAAGLVTDGASIPRWAQPIVGRPFTPAYVKAAVIHDHYCVRHVRPWRQTHRVFYDALRKSGVPASTAATMYFAILIGGPKWVKLVPGRPCPVGLSCIHNVEEVALMPGMNLAIGENSELLATRPDLYETATFETALRENTPAIEALGDTLTPEQIEALAKQALPDDFFFRSGEEVGSNLSIELKTQEPAQPQQ
jgi:hypothetical protein